MRLPSRSVTYDIRTPRSGDCCGTITSRAPSAIAAREWLQDHNVERNVRVALRQCGDCRVGCPQPRCRAGSVQELDTMAELGVTQHDDVELDRVNPQLDFAFELECGAVPVSRGR